MTNVPNPSRGHILNWKGSVSFQTPFWFDGGKRHTIDLRYISICHLYVFFLSHKVNMPSSQGKSRSCCWKCKTTFSPSIVNMYIFHQNWPEVLLKIAMKMSAEYDYSLVPNRWLRSCPLNQKTISSVCERTNHPQ